MPGGKWEADSSSFVSCSSSFHSRWFLQSGFPWPGGRFPPRPAFTLAVRDTRTPTAPSRPPSPRPAAVRRSCFEPGPVALAPAGMALAPLTVQRMPHALDAGPTGSPCRETAGRASARGSSPRTRRSTAPLRRDLRQGRSRWRPPRSAQVANYGAAAGPPSFAACARRSGVSPGLPAPLRDLRHAAGLTPASSLGTMLPIWLRIGSSE